MNTEQREQLKSKILKIYKEAESRTGRFDRLVKEPLKSIPFFCKQIVARIKPFKVKHKTLWGDTMSFYLPEGNAISYYGYYEADLTNFLTNILNDGDVFFDIGTHVGFYTVLASRLTSPTGSVHGFEPTPRTFKTLSENTSKLQNVTINNVAVLDKETEIDFIDYGPRHSAFNTYKDRTGEGMKFLDKAEHVKVKTISLDKYCKEKSTYPTVVKIDAEGAEHLILQSMNEILSTAKPIVTIEVGGGVEWQSNCKKSIDFLLDKGYRCFETTIEGNIKPHEPKELYSYDNLIFAHPDKLTRLEKYII